jgi:hypothetical protein
MEVEKMKDIRAALAEYAAIVEGFAKEYTNSTTAETVRAEHPELDFMDDDEIVELLEHAKNQRNTAQQDEVARDAEGRRLAKCVLCGKIDYVDKFTRYGEKGYINEGTCRKCVKILDESKNHGYRKLPRTTRPLTNSIEDQKLLARFLKSEEDWEE